MEQKIESYNLIHIEGSGASFKALKSEKTTTRFWEVNVEHLVYIMMSYIIYIWRDSLHLSEQGIQSYKYKYPNKFKFLEPMGSHPEPGSLIISVLGVVEVSGNRLWRRRNVKAPIRPGTIIPPRISPTIAATFELLVATVAEVGLEAP